MSEPHESRTFSAFAVVERSGSPAVMYGIKATLTQINYFEEQNHRKFRKQDLKLKNNQYIAISGSQSVSVKNGQLSCLVHI